jgi:hypothetical protein
MTVEVLAHSGDIRMFDPHRLPEGPPALGEHIAVSQHMGQVQKIITKLSQELELLPVVLSQESEPIAFAGLPGATSAEHIAKLVDRVWQEGAHRQAREFVRFEEASIDGADERTMMMFYSTHVVGGIVLTVGWNVSISLTQIRAEVSDVKLELLDILGVGEE